jgi:hypothetical protein
LTKGKVTLHKAFDFCGIRISEEECLQIMELHSFENMKERRPTGDPLVKSSPGHYYKGKIGTWQEDLNDSEHHEFNQVAGDLLVELGYASPGWCSEVDLNNEKPCRLWKRLLYWRLKFLSLSILGCRLTKLIESQFRSKI